MTAGDDLAADLRLALDLEVDDAPERGAMWMWEPALQRFTVPASETERLPGAIADHLLAAGWSRPRVVTTAAELAPLPADTVVIDRRGTAFTRRRGGAWTTGFAAYDTESVAFYGSPLTVVWSPPVESGETQGGAR